MIRSIKQLWEKYQAIVLYMIFGVATTVVNVLVYWLSAHLLGLSVMASTALAWILAVLFAYVTNRRWVFKSAAKVWKEIIKEIIAFFVCRLATGLVDGIAMFILVDIVGLNDIIVKAAANIIVIILNYIASKMIIFKKR